MKPSKRKIISLFSFLILMQSCGEEVKSTFTDYTEEEYALLSERLDLPLGIFEYNVEFDEAFFNNNLGQGNIQSRRSNHKATLGRVLFYDKLLSANESVSCASCHKQELAFADDVAFSEGFDGGATTRNSLPLGNTIGFEASYGGGDSFSSQRAQFSWDESNADIASQSKAAITSEVEMGMHMNEAVTRVRQQSYYGVLFEKAYGDKNILEHRVLEAIEEFVNSIVSSNSKFDHESMKADGAVNSEFSGYSTSENRGKNLYLDNCASCHSADHKFTEIATANNGLELYYEDQGVGEHNSSPSKRGVFKVPFLRNIELSGPYMHDGRFATLDEVIDHYSDGIVNHENLHENLKTNTGSPKSLNFTDLQKEDLKAYLLTLTDYEMIADVKFSDPFK